MQKGEQTEKKTERILWGTGSIFTLALLLCIFMTNLFHYNYKMNSDIGAEAVLGSDLG